MQAMRRLSPSLPLAPVLSLPTLQRDEMEWATGDHRGDGSEEVRSLRHELRSRYPLPIIGHRPDLSRPACRAAIVYGRVSVRADRSVRQASARSAPRSQLRAIATRAELALTLHRVTWVPGGTP